MSDGVRYEGKQQKVDRNNKSRNLGRDYNLCEKQSSTKKVIFPIHTHGERDLIIMTSCKACMLQDRAPGKVP